MRTYAGDRASRGLREHINSEVADTAPGAIERDDHVHLARFHGGEEPIEARPAILGAGHARVDCTPGASDHVLPEVSLG